LKGKPAAVGEPQMVDKLKKGETVAGKTYKAAFLLIRGRHEHCGA
jgi:hypothetical protein